DQLVWIALTIDDGIENGSAGLAVELGENRSELQVGILKNLVDPLQVSCALTNELPAGAGQIAHRLDRRGRNETAPATPGGEQVRDPRGVVNVRLAARDVPDVSGVGEYEVKWPLQHVPDGLPVHPGGLHRDMRDLEAGEPVAQGQQL